VLLGWELRFSFSRGEITGSFWLLAAAGCWLEAFVNRSTLYTFRVKCFLSFVFFMYCRFGFLNFKIPNYLRTPSLRTQRGTVGTQCTSQQRFGCTPCSSALCSTCAYSGSTGTHLLGKLSRSPRSPSSTKSAETRSYP